LQMNRLSGAKKLRYRITRVKDRHTDLKMLVAGSRAPAIFAVPVYVGKAAIRNIYFKLLKIDRDAFLMQRMLLDKRGGTILDIGARIGETTAKYSRLFPESTIYSFEPFADSFQLLQRRFKENNFIKPVNMAVSDKQGKMKFYVNKDSGTSSIFPTVADVKRWVKLKIIENIDVIEVPVTTIDEFCQQQSINDIQILKMDIQGGELLALEGAKEKLKKGAISVIYTEVWFVKVYEGEALFNELYSFLSGFGYKLFDIYNFEHDVKGQLKWADAIFVSPFLKI
jgi:FkbM family methyltransferase